MQLEMLGFIARSRFYPVDLNHEFCPIISSRGGNENNVR
jgi:hypothetical protein